MFNKTKINTQQFAKAQRIFALCFCIILFYAPTVLAQSNDMMNRINRLENEIETLNRAVYKGETPPRPIYNTNTEPSNGTAQMEIRIQQMETQMRELTGKIEEQLFTINQLKQDILRLEEKNAVAMEPAATTSPQQQSFVPTQPLGIDFEANKPKGMQTTTPIATTNDATAQYENAYFNLQEGNHFEARELFQEFLEKHPQHVLSANAQYWLGETYYVEGEFQNSAKTFAQGFQAFPDSAKSPDMLLKLGLSLSNLGKQEEACIALSQLPVKFKAGPQNILDRGANEMDRLNCGS